MAALLITAELMDLLTARIAAPIELVTLAAQSQLDQVRGVVVSAGCVLDFAFDRQRHQLQIWPRLQLQALVQA